MFDFAAAAAGSPGIAQLSAPVRYNRTLLQALSPSGPSRSAENVVLSEIPNVARDTTERASVIPIAPGVAPHSSDDTAGRPDFGYSLETGLNRAAKDTVKAHMPLAMKMAGKYAARYRIEHKELIAAAFLGLMEAARGFDPKRRSTFGTYAALWIRATLNEHVRVNVGPTKIRTRREEKVVFFWLARVKAQLGIHGNGDLEPKQAQQIAAILGVSEQAVIDGDRRRASAISLAQPAGSDDDGKKVTFGDLYPVDPFGAPVGHHGKQRCANWAEDILIEHVDNKFADGRRRKLLRRAIECLDDRERAIIEERHGDDKPVLLASLADRFNISVERVRQIETKAIDKIARHIRGAKGTVERPRTRHERQIADLTRSRDTNDNILRHAVMGRFGCDASIPNEFDARIRSQIARTQRRAETDRAERLAWRRRAVAAGLSWAVPQ